MDVIVRYAPVRIALLWASCLAPLGLALAAERSAGAAVVDLAPSPRVYLGREIAQTMHYQGAPWLVRESRQREEDSRRLLAKLGVKPGQVVADLGCGNGFYTLPLARLVGAGGKVYAVDIQAEMLQLVTSRAARARLKNVAPVLGAPSDPKLPAGAVDLVLMVDVYHEFSHPEPMLAAIAGCLKADGRVALAEFRAEDPAVPIQPLHKMSKRQIVKEFNANGFQLVNQFDGLPWQHLMFFVYRPHEDTAP